MKLAIGADHAGFQDKQWVIEWLKSLGHEVIDVGTSSIDSTDYPDFAVKASLAVSTGKCDRAILVCGTGIGMSMAANKIRGIRAAAVQSVKASHLSRAHNDANVLCVGSRLNTPEEIKAIIDEWLKTEFEGGERHCRRIEKIAQLDKERK